MRDLLRSAAGGLLAVGAIVVGIVVLNLLVHPPRPSGDGPVVQAPISRSPAASPTVTAAPSRSVLPTVPPTPGEASPSAPASPLPAASASPSPSPAVAPRLALTVLNNSRRTGLAARAAREFERGGWDVRETGNYRPAIVMTTVYYGPGQDDSARRLMREFPDVERMLPRPAGMPGAPGLTVVLTRDYPA